MILIVGEYKGRKEVLDSADTYKEAMRLRAEYALAFGPSWQVWVQGRNARV
jgi:hypothetical protein